MDSIDEQLLRYRREKAKERYKQQLLEKSKHIGTKVLGIGSFFGWLFSKGRSMVDKEHHIHLSENEPEAELEEVPFNYLKWLTIFLVWVCVYILFIYIQFGAVYFCISMLIFIYYNTRTGRKSRGEVSAYSVFNRNCEQIDGTFTAEQFDKQIRSGMLY